MVESNLLTEIKIFEIDHVMEAAGNWTPQDCSHTGQYRLDY